MGERPKSEGGEVGVATLRFVSLWSAAIHCRFSFWSAAIHCRFSFLVVMAATCRKTSQAAHYRSTESGDESPHSKIEPPHSKITNSLFRRLKPPAQKGKGKRNKG
jgi:hypothetical protein